MERIIEHTDDGSATLYVPELDEHYHSVKGAWTESQHIFVDMGFRHSSIENPRVLEIGFGTGLNAYLTLLAADKINKKVHYTGMELYPLTWEIVKKLKYSDNELFRLLHTVSWEEDTLITSNFTLRKTNADFTTIYNHLPTRKEEDIASLYDVVYFDAFAPEKQPEMWQQQLFNELFVIINRGGIFTTYCAKGTIRRMLQNAGFKVERLAGPPGGKREILRATKN